MIFYAVLLLLFLLLVLALLNNLHRLCLEATDRASVALFLDGGDVGLGDVITGVFRGGIKIHFYSEGVDEDLSIPCQAYKWANTSHPPDPLTRDWEEVKDAALSSTRGAIKHFECIRGPNEDTRLYTFIQSITLSIYLHLFFRVPITSTNIDDAVWIASNTWRTEQCRLSKEPIGHPPELCRLVKPSPNPSGVFALLSATQRLILAAICDLEHRRGNIQFLRRAGTLLRHPTAPEPDVTRFIERVKESYPSIQSVHGKLSLRYPPLRWAAGVDFFIPTDSLPPSACIMDSDGTCHSWLHKASLPGPPACGGDKWLIQITAIILSAIEMEIRDARLIVDRDGHDPEAWEAWTLRRLRVG